MIASNLDWDEEALEDKIIEGLKPNVQSALIYFPEDAENLEETMARAQKIDRQQWENRRERNSYRQIGNRKRDLQKKGLDWDGDTLMTGAKIRSEEAKEKGLCFNCEKKGHLAKNCRQKKYHQKKPQQKTDKKDVTIKMGRTTSGVDALNQEIEREEPTESRIELEPMEVTSLFQGLTSKDFSETESSDEETLMQEERYIEHEQDEFTKEVPRVPEGQSDGKHSFIRAHEEVSVLQLRLARILSEKNR